MDQLLVNYYWIFLVISVALFGLTIWIRIKKAKVLRDKAIYSIYSIILGLFTIALILYKVGI
ncbi:hypothetical protein [Heyndrickxia camelliae]|uniref:Uncharacterized protein n=1 Tax=Heyndrickxia camelliae TaxID=1707093 RepID=A0A2N3LES7_9BACI|nr:hypothetical protein [Heyndrickxia camelliae]PKR83057.1 hypothetical protein CWO92_21205 [Heyndrickxia camelliae]